ncbi:hypothetical protein CEPID_01090 [Corynebacterium epidermidicanis]|uniref:Uncharacterized protein n=1 Tax=Corynebacterium epidermidicanis TaxID=1050174 RepID=A0A0G3GRE8_9CORY|nr:hypothetical protein CEPID_01090 [Corynebacterium epidermidicanis]
MSFILFRLTQATPRGALIIPRPEKDPLHRNAVDALIAKGRERLASEVASREMSEAERGRARFKVIG